jgi:hypothetical protein
MSYFVHFAWEDQNSAQRVKCRAVLVAGLGYLAERVVVEQTADMGKTSFSLIN